MNEKPAITREEFIQKLKEASREVEKWPKWEQNLLGSVKITKTRKVND